MVMEERFSQNFNKLYYSIGEVADIFGVNASLIRFWEKEFDVIKPKKNAKGDRKFTPKDIEIIHRIHGLVKIKGYTLEGAKKNLKSRNKSTEESIDSKVDSDEILMVENVLLHIKSELLKLKSR